MTNKDYWQMLKNLPHAVIKETDKSTEYYELCIESFDGIYSLEYVMISYPYDLKYPFSCTGNSLEEVVEKAFTFFEKNIWKYKFVKRDE